MLQFDGPGTFTPRKKAREKPLLVPPCRKLRHLTSLSVRNLSSHRPRKHRQDRASDDAQLGTHSTQLQRTPKGKGKASVHLSVGENYVQHSRSSTDLVGQKDFALWNAKQDAGGTGFGSPAKGKRRPTIDRDKSEKREEVREVREDGLFDCFFSLHSTDPEPIYVSEVVERTLNPNFQTCDFSGADPEISRLDALTVKIWVKEHRVETWTLLLELELPLAALQFIGTSLENFRHPLPPNCVVFHLTDGCYTTFSDMAPSETKAPKPPPLDRIADYKDTSSYDSLLRLRNLEECTLDAETTQEVISSQIEEVLSKNSQGFTAEDGLSETRESLSTIQSRLAVSRKRIAALQARKSSLQHSINKRNTLLAEAKTVLTSSSTHLHSAAGQLATCTDTLEVTREALLAQQRRIISDLQRIYPIDATNGALSFTIRSLPLPNSSTAFNVPDDQLAAALGYTAHLVHNLALYLSVPLRYPILLMGSTSVIQDPISTLQSSRTFPLYRSGNDLHKFEYAVFLLQKNIELLCASCGVRVVDIRHTLPNIKYLMYIVGESGRLRREKLIK